MKEFIKKHLLIFVCLLAAGGISLVLAFSENSGEILVEKDGYAGEEQQIGILLKKEETTEHISLNVRPRKLTREQREKRMEEAFLYLDEHMKGDNTSLSKVVTDLDFSLDYEAYPFDVEIRPGDYVLLDEEGNVKNEKETLETLGYESKELEEGISTSVTVILWYGEESSQKTYSLKVYPEKERRMEAQFSKVKKQILQEEEKALYEEYFVLPEAIEDIQLKRTDTNRISPFHVLLLGFVIAGLLLLREKEMIRNREKKRQEQLRRSYPWFINEMTLLMGAGMQIKNILTVFIEEYERDFLQIRKEKAAAGKEDYRAALVCELKWAKHSLEIGMSEEQVYYQLGRRLKLPCYIKLMTLLEQNVKRGSKGLIALFEQEEINALEERKNLAKRYGEEASTKLLGPMILLLLVVMLMIMVPAFLSFA